MRRRGLSRFVLAAVIVSFSGAVMVSSGAARAQTSVPAGRVTPFVDTSMLKPPPGAKVAIIEWEDLECPGCAHAYPFVQAAVARYHIPLVLYDFHIPGHIWSHDAAIYARYLQEQVSPRLADEYRQEVFASQSRIASREDLDRFTQEFFAKNGKQFPVMGADPSGDLERQVNADNALGLRLNHRMYTPTIIVVTRNHWIEVKDAADLNDAIDQAEASVGKK